MPDRRTDADEVLARFKRSQGEDSSGASLGDMARPRGRHKIFFGMSPGVGKTYAMLAAAQRHAAQGVDVVVGVVETHGRSETEQMLLGLDIVSPRRIPYGGTTLSEFDAEAAIARRPDLLLVDELAHTNAPGSNREKRWQDVEQCLKAGVNVYTTLNVQHLESLNDVVTQITGVAVRETVPDRVFDEADEVELVDLPPEVLHERLRAGKVYMGEHAARAVDPSDGFFRRGNLTALRELALRRTAAWVDSDLRRYKQDQGIRSVWPASERIVVAVSPSPMSGRVVRAAKRMAAGLHADLIAVYVETPRTADLVSAERERLDQHMRLAESLGATTATLAGASAARELIAFARSRNVGKIVVGKTERPRWQEALFGSFIDNLIRASGDIDIYVVRGDEWLTDAAAETRSSPGTDASSASTRGAGRYAAALLLVTGVTALGVFAFSGLELANIVMVYLASVVIAALWLGRGPAIVTAAAGVAAFDFCFVPPRWTFAVSDVQYLVTFGVMLGVGLVIGTLASRTREQARHAWARERTTSAQYALSRELAAASDAVQVAAIVARHTHDLLQADAIVCRSVAADAGRASPRLDVIAAAGSPDWFDERERGVAQWAMEHGRAAGAGTQRLPSAAGRYVPLLGTSGKVGLLCVRPRQATWEHLETRALDSVVIQAASALERVMLSESQHAARLEAERERLRSALLSSVSHDLRTPLASITGAASTLEGTAGGAPLDRSTQAALLRTIVQESSRLSDLIANLVFATRLEAGSVTLRREWTTLEEIVGVGLSKLREPLATRSPRIHLPSDLPMVRVDNAMLPQVVHNLVENALHYTPAGTPISINAWTVDERIVVKIADEGPGLAEDEASRVFERFYRGRESRSHASTTAATTGMGLGLTICEGIIRAHGGMIWAEPNTPRGVAFLFSLPIERPQPALPPETTEMSPEPAAGSAA